MKILQKRKSCYTEQVDALRYNSFYVVYVVIQMPEAD